MLHSRIERIESLLKTEIGAIIDQELANPNLPDFITVFRVKLTKDLSQAMVFFTFLQDQTPEVIAGTVEELNHAAGYIGHLVAERIQLKRHPRLKFTYSESTRHALEMEKLFLQIQREQEQVQAPEGEDLPEVGRQGES